MKVTVFTNNAARHISLVEAAAEAFDEVFVIQECNTLFPGKVEDFFRKSDVMQEYFSHVIAAEQEVFGLPRFMPAGVRTMALHYGDPTLLELDMVKECLDADAFIVFGASYIKGALIDELIERQAINIHMGVAPFYRGHSSNFWALYDHRPDLVGATVHHLGRGLDNGAILRHSFPTPDACDPFVYGMRAVKAAHQAVIEGIKSGELLSWDAVPQDKSQELRYTKGVQFSDEVALEYLRERRPSPEDVLSGAQKRDLSLYLRPYVG